MIECFIDRMPYLQDYKDLVEEEFHHKNGWRINHTQYVGKKFFYIEFKEFEDTKSALASAPWFYGRKYMYTFPWF